MHQMHERHLNSVLSRTDFNAQRGTQPAHELKKLRTRQPHDGIKHRNLKHELASQTQSHRGSESEKIEVALAADLRTVRDMFHRVLTIDGLTDRIAPRTTTLQGRKLLDRKLHEARLPSESMATLLHSKTEIRDLTTTELEMIDRTMIDRTMIDPTAIGPTMTALTMIEREMTDLTTIGPSRIDLIRIEIGTSDLRRTAQHRMLHEGTELSAA